MHIQVGGAKLPIEIIDQAIDHLHNDRSSLLSCALTSRSCLTASRFHLFSRVHVFCGRRGPDTFQQFGGFLQDTPSVCPYIRHLTLNGRAATPHPREICSHRLSDLVSQLPRLAVLELHDTRFVCRCEEDFPLVARKNVDSLVIHGAEVSTLRTTIAVLSVFATIRTLHIGYLQLFLKSDLYTMPLAALSEALSAAVAAPWLSVESLILQPYQDRAAVRALCLILRSVLAAESLRFLEINIPLASSISGFQALLKAVGGHLHEVILHHQNYAPLGIAPDFSPEGEAWSDSMLLAHCSHLHTLRFQALWLATDGEDRYFTPEALLDTIVEVLSSDLHDVQRIAFDLSLVPDPGCASELDSFPFAQVQAAAYRLKHLPTVVFTLLNPPNGSFATLPSLTVQITQALTDLDQQGRLLLQ